MDWYNIIKRYYDKGIYTKEDVGMFVQYEKITATQYEEIIGEPYTA